jgi:uracil-DNA glycosylase family 4
MVKRDPHCKRCPLHQTADFVCLLGQGPKNADIMLIGEAPGHREDDSGTPFVGRSGQLLDDIITEAGLSRDDIFITNAVSCRPPDNRTPKKREMDACKYWLDKQIEEVKPRYIGLLGNVAIQQVLGLKGIKKLRGRPIEQDGVTYLPMYHPSYILRGDLQDMPTAVQDMRKLREIEDFGGIPEERALNSHIVSTWREVDEMLDALIGIVSFDLETTCLYPWADEAAVVTLGFGTSQGEWSLFINHKDSNWTPSEIKRIIVAVTERLKECIVVAHNGKFDALWMFIHYKVLWRVDFDTMLAHHILDENSRHDLEFLARLYFSAPDWDIPLAEKQGNAPTSRIAKYHAHDLYYTRKLYPTLRKLLAQDKPVCWLFDHLIMPAANLYVEMEAHGCYIDVPKMTDVEKKLRQFIATAERKLARWGDISWSSPKQVAQLLYGKLKIKCPMQTKKGAPSTAESALKMIEHPCVTDLLTLRGHKQQLSFFIEGWKPYLRDRRIHPSFKLHGTVTGRPSSEHPNFQQVPRDPFIRSLVTSPDGWSLLEADLSQIELRIVAELSRCSAMMEAFVNGVDIHWKTALGELERYVGQEKLVLATASTAEQRKVTSYAEAIAILRDIGPDVAAEINPLWKEMRKKAKAVGFGYVYGMGSKKFKVYARDNYDMHLTDAEAHQSRIAYFQMYPLEKWHASQRKFAYHKGYVSTLSGRKRRLPHAQDKRDTPERAEAWRQAINSPVQGFASDINLMVLLQLRREFPRAVLRPTITVHDSILMEVRNDWVERVATRVQEIMRRPDLFDTFDIQLTVPIEGEVKIGPWGSGVSLKKWREK